MRSIYKQKIIIDVKNLSVQFNTPHGFHLAKVTERKTGEVKDFEAVKNIIKEDLIILAQDKKLKLFIEELRKSAEIEYTEPSDELHGND